MDILFINCPHIVCYCYIQYIQYVFGQIQTRLDTPSSPTFPTFCCPPTHPTPTCTTIPPPPHFTDPSLPSFESPNPPPPPEARPNNIQLFFTPSCSEHVCTVTQGQSRRFFLYHRDSVPDSTGQSVIVTDSTCYSGTVSRILPITQEPA
jgi:hypothetical protein